MPFDSIQNHFRSSGNTIWFFWDIRSISAAGNRLGSGQYLFFGDISCLELFYPLDCSFGFFLERMIQLAGCKYWEPVPDAYVKPVSFLQDWFCRRRPISRLWNNRYVLVPSGDCGIIFTKWGREVIMAIGWDGFRSASLPGWSPAFSGCTSPSGCSH